MKPKPFWLLNHFTVPLFIGALPFDTFVFKPRHNAAGSSRFWGEGRQSGALFAARPSRSAETRWSRDGYRSPDPQGVCQSEASIQRYRTCVYPTICRADRIRPCFGGFSQCLASRLTPSQRTRSSPFPNVDSFSREQTGTVAARAQWTDRLQGDPEPK